jgi:trigger factor
MSVVIAYEDAGPCRKLLTIEVPAPAVDAEVGRVMRDLSQKVRIDGFRRGKVPRSIIRKRFKEEIKQEVVDRLVPRYWHQAEAEKSLDTVTPPQITELKLEDGEPMTFVAEVDVRPEIALALDQPFDLPDPSIEPSEAEIEETLDDLRRHHATWHPVERAAAVGDRTLGTVRLLTVDGEPHAHPETGEADEAGSIDIEVGDARVWEELSLAATGLSAGQGTDFERKIEGEDAKTLRYRVEVEEVRERELPELNDDFAKKIGDFADADALVAAVTERIRFGKRDGRRKVRREKLLEQLRDRHAISLPERLVDQEREQMLHRVLHRMSEQGADVENLDEEYWLKLGEQVRPEAEKAVHEQLVLDAVAEAEDVRVDEKVFEQVIASWAAEKKISRLALRQELAESGRLSTLRAQMRRDRTIARLTGEEAEAEAEAAALSEAEEATVTPATVTPAEGTQGSAAEAADDSAGTASGPDAPKED